MPRQYSRITLEITDIRAERLQQITEADALAEGAPADFDTQGTWQEARHWFRHRWEGLNAKRGFGWSASSWVWVLTVAVR